MAAMRKFPAYTYSDLMAEDPDLFRLAEIEALGRPVDPEGGEY